jgi:hypothetical protein
MTEHKQYFEAFSADNWKALGKWRNTSNISRRSPQITGRHCRSNTKPRIAWQTICLFPQVFNTTVVLSCPIQGISKLFKTKSNDRGKKYRG